MKIGIILTPDNRSKAFLSKIIKNNISIDSFIFMNDNRQEQVFDPLLIDESKKSGFDISQSVYDLLIEHNISFQQFNFVDINNPTLIRYVRNCNIDYFIFTGGGILRSEILNSGSKFIHFHPVVVQTHGGPRSSDKFGFSRSASRYNAVLTGEGYVVLQPNYRGSTCFYYSILNENNCGVTCFIMDENLDTGKIILQKIFPPPPHIFIDQIYDPFIRSEVLIEVLQNNLLKKGNFHEQNPNSGETYFVIHPVLKHLAILRTKEQL